MTIDTAKWRACAPLLPDGGCEAVRQLCDEIDRLCAFVEQLAKERLEIDEAFKHWRESHRLELEKLKKENDDLLVRAWTIEDPIGVKRTKIADIERQTAERIATLAVQRALERTACPNPYHDDINDRNDAAADALRDFADDVRAFAWKETT